jgi:cellulose biosynthesis protein BcsQ
MNPSLSSINQNLLMTSDFFIVPTSPDYFSVMAVESLSTVIPRWHAWSNRAKSNPILKSATYPYPDKNPKFIGTIIQRYRPRKGSPTEGFQKWIDTINEHIAKQLVPTLEPLKMLLPKERYKQVPELLPDFCLAQIADFNTLIAKSQDHKTPVFALTDVQLGHAGTVLAEDQRKRQEFYGVFEKLVERVSTLTNDASSI